MTAKCAHEWDCTGHDTTKQYRIWRRIDTLRSWADQQKSGQTKRSESGGAGGRELSPPKARYSRHSLNRAVLRVGDKTDDEPPPRSALGVGTLARVNLKHTKEKSFPSPVVERPTKKSFFSIEARQTDTARTHESRAPLAPVGELIAPQHNLVRGLIVLLALLGRLGGKRAKGRAALNL